MEFSYQHGIGCNTLYCFYLFIKLFFYQILYKLSTMPNTLAVATTFLKIQASENQASAIKNLNNVPLPQ